MKPLLFVCFLWLLANTVCGQAVFRIDSLPANGVVLDKNWKWHLGDNPAWANSDLDDSRWDTLNPAQDMTSLRQLPQQGIGWFRIRLQLAPQLRGKPTGLVILQSGATELFLNGRFVARNGIINSQKQLAQGAFHKAFSFIPLGTDSVQVVAVRYVFTKERLLKYPTPFLTVTLMTSEQAEKIARYQEFDSIFETFLFGIFLALGILQLLLFIASPEQRATLSLGLFLLAQSVTHLLAGVGINYDLMTKTLGINKVALIGDAIRIAFSAAIAFSAFFYLLGIYQYFRQPKKVLFYVGAILSLATIPANMFLDSPYNYFSLFLLGFIIPWAEILRVSLKALSQQKTGAKLFTLAHGILLAIFIVYTSAVFIPVFGNFLGGSLIFNLFTLSFLGLALVISLLLAQERAAASRLLSKQLVELDNLSQRTIAQEQEKQQLLANQNERLEQQVEARTAQLAQSLTELKATQEQLIQKEKLASLGELTAGIAHEIQNPLNFVNNFAEVSAELIDELKDEAQAGRTDDVLAIADDLTQNLQKIQHHGGRASSIVRGMLEHSRTDSGDKRPTDLNALAEEYFKIAYHGLRAKDKSFNCELVTDFEPNLSKVAMVSQEIGRVLLNLFNNAFYAVSERTKQNGKRDYQPSVKVSTHQNGSGVEICVSDNGTGIPESVKDKIFQPFFTTKPTGEGTGLGLSLSYDIVTKGHAGTLTVESQPEQGTIFTISLP